MNKTVTALLIFSLLLSVFIIVSTDAVNAQNASVIRIKEDGTVTGTDKIRHSGVVYTLTGDLSAGVGSNEAFIFVERSDIIFDGAGYTIQGSGLGSAICLLRSQNVTVENFVIRDFSKGIDFWTVENWPSDSNYLSKPSASNNKIINNVIETSRNANSNRTRDAGWCIYLTDAMQSVISSNTFTCQNPQGGVYLGNSTRNTNLVNNNFVGCRIYSLVSNQTVAYGNTVDGKSLVYLDGKSNQVFEEAGLVYLFNCSGISVKNVNPSYDYAVTIQMVDTVKSDVSNSGGYVLLINSSQNSIHDNRLNSVTFDASSYNKVFANTVTDFSVCIKLYGDSNFNTIYGNALLDTLYSVDAENVHTAGSETVAIQLGDPQFGGAFNNNIHNNTIISHDCAVKLILSSNNTIADNLLKDCRTGILLGKSHFNVFTENNVTSCKYAVGIYAESSNNTFFCNNFIDNEIQCIETHYPTLLSETETYSIGNTWDNGKMGNYWSTYNGIDANNDGIGDTPYTVFEYMIDNYPLIKTFQFFHSLPQYDPPSTPTPNNDKPLITQEKLPTIIGAIIILSIISGIILYFRRLIFR
ncbi:MAG: right-handed parallel beta-helix repeat-containing protein [Nitrososphaerota archaeon]|nr:right-handed parallel beta-helix repeat-containing protein [Nitrososphaerota archaeon]